jgi:hypothetical protein
MPSTPLAMPGEWRLLVATPDEILSPELLGLSYHLRARRRLDWITRWRGDSELAQPPFRAIDRY